MPPCQKPNHKTKNYRVTLPNSAAFNFLNIELCLSRVFERNFGLGEGNLNELISKSSNARRIAQDNVKASRDAYCSRRSWCYEEKKPSHFEVLHRLSSENRYKKTIFVMNIPVHIKLLS